MLISAAFYIPARSELGGPRVCFKKGRSTVLYYGGKQLDQYGRTNELYEVRDANMPYRYLYKQTIIASR